jgi:hypothetical protein
MKTLDEFIEQRLDEAFAEVEAARSAIDEAIKTRDPKKIRKEMLAFVAVTRKHFGPELN